MREVTIKLYQYGELSEEAKERAREWFLSDYPEYGWWEFVYEDVDVLARNISLIIKPHTSRNMRGETIAKPGFNFDLDRQELIYQGYYVYDKTWKDKCRHEYSKDVFKRDSALSKFLRAWEEKILALQKPAFYGITIDVDCQRSINIDVHNVYDREITDTQLRQVEELIELFNDHVLDMLQREYDYITSEAYAEEMIIANAYEFTEDGTIA
ncbi:MAG: hypothetical protein IJA20_02700 [Methanocorpusculum sp.]|nr:hypothetical protein [Methanocorpusculum sp.]